MGATSVTGVSGAGSAEKSGIKGPGNGRNQYVPLVGPHIVLAEQVTLASGAATYTFPKPLAGGKAKYVVAASAAHAVTVTKTDSNDAFVSITLAGTGTDVVDVLVSKIGQA